jgi:hypothetical protein
MTGYPQFNIPAFDATAERLRDEGYMVTSPAELDGPNVREQLMRSESGDPRDLPVGTTWGDFLARDVKMLADDGIEGVVVLRGWNQSKGARLETFVAYALCGLPVLRMHATDGEVHLREVDFLTLVRAWAESKNLMFYQQPYGPL